jgi:hypothetical protein
MSAMSDYLEGELRKHIFRTGSFTKPTGLWVALFTSAPSDAGGGTEVSGGSYARVSVAPLDANWTAGSSTDGVTSNASAITFAAPTANWGTVTHFGLFDASTAGNLLVHGALTASRIINNGDAAPSFAAGALTVTFA